MLTTGRSAGQSAGLAQLVAGVRAAQPRAIGRAVSLVENNAPALPALLAAIAADTGRAQVIGLTGAPGVGKSTTTGALVSRLRAQGQRVGVLAIDPSSPFSGGALLGDRVRMQEHALDPEVHIRSMATRGHLGGLAVAAPAALRVFDAAGCDTVLVETVGVGQSEVDIAGVADVTVVLVAPGMGDSVQAAKAGLLEVGDIFLVNKADRDGASALVLELRSMIVLGARPPGSWSPTIVSAVASHGEGIDTLLEQLEAFRTAQQHGGAADRRLGRARREVEQLALARLRTQLRLDGPALSELARRVRDGELDAYAAAAELLARRGGQPGSSS